VLFRYARAYILFLFDSVLFTDPTEKHVPLIYLMLLNDFNGTPIYSWGSAILACLYKHLYLECMKEAEQVEGCLLLL
jgi:hypothetical protein